MIQAFLLVLALSGTPDALLNRAASPSTHEHPSVAGVATGNAHEVKFDTYSPLSSNRELLRRLLSPLTAARLPDILAQKQVMLRDQPISLINERFTLYVPRYRPANGYKLMVFVPPWQSGFVPPGWSYVLDRAGMIFVSAQRSGNDESVLGRREPLAILAAVNVMKDYFVDPSQVYVAGFSGGSHIALRLALGFPDLFRGALLDAGSDEIGNAEIPLPPRDLMYELQGSSHIVFVRGQDDTVFLSDSVSASSLKKWCIFNVTERLIPMTSHVIATPTVLATAIEALTADGHASLGELEPCRLHQDNRLSASFEQAQGRLKAGDIQGAREILRSIDREYGGLAEPQSVELFDTLNDASVSHSLNNAVHHQSQ